MLKTAFALVTMIALLNGGEGNSTSVVQKQWEAAWYENIDWVEYYKCCGNPINSRPPFAPVFVSPQMQWAVPNSTLTGTPTGHPGVPQGMFGYQR